MRIVFFSGMLSKMIEMNVKIMIKVSVDCVYCKSYFGMVSLYFLLWELWLLMRLMIVVDFVMYVVFKELRLY